MTHGEQDVGTAPAVAMQDRPCRYLADEVLQITRDFVQPRSESECTNAFENRITTLTDELRLAGMPHEIIVIAAQIEGQKRGATEEWMRETMNLPPGQKSTLPAWAVQRLEEAGHFDYPEWETSVTR